MLFAIAVFGERRPRAFEGQWPAIYALSLAVYCTSWTFFGTVTQAARYDWPLPPTFVGTIALYVLGAGVLVKLVRQVRESNTTSLADYIATRLGKDGWLAAVVTLVAILGIVPYIALQLKAVAMSFALLVREPALQAPAWQDSALYVALAMAAFVMLFGTRSASAVEHNRGLVLAMAFEALLKLGAMLALGWFVVGLPEALHDTAMNLTCNQHRIDRFTEIIDHGIATDFRNTGFRVDLDLAYMSAVGKCRRIGLMGCLGIETRFGTRG